MKNLVIVESPAKAKTIEKYLGKDFHVLSSVGHIRSIVKKTKDGTPPIDVANDFFAIYEVDPEKKKVITELKRNVNRRRSILRLFNNRANMPHAGQDVKILAEVFLDGFSFGW